VGAVSQLLAAHNVTDGRITPHGLRWCIAGCIEAGHTGKLLWPALRADRRAVLPGGLAILYTLATHFGIDSLVPARGALRQGVIIDLRERLEALRHAHPEDVRDESVRELQTRFGVAADQALRVRTLAQSLYQSVADIDDVLDESPRELGWACDLHEVGQMVSHHDHHRHSAYLVANVDAAGFSQSQQRRISELVLGQRGGLRKLDPALTHAQFAWQTLCLRLAVIKCHARGAIDTRALQLKRDDGTALLGFSPSWAENHPRTLHLLREEAEAWSRQGSLKLVLPR
jgi:exopolyphosphatase/guanosine-5'-triphosphate,3'-diphosphate pyrophosphatase